MAIMGTISVTALVSSVKGNSSGHVQNNRSNSYNNDNSWDECIFGSGQLLSCLISIFDFWG